MIGWLFNVLTDLLLLAVVIGTVGIGALVVAAYAQRLYLWARSLVRRWKARHANVAPIDERLN